MLFRLVPVVLCLAALPALSFGQAARSEDPRTTSRMHLGPFYLTPTVTLTELGVDTNVFNTAGEIKKDFTFTITPGVITAVPVARRGLLRATTRADLVYYKTYASERSINPQLALRGELYFNRLTLFAEPSYLRTRQRPSYEIDARSLRVERGTVAGVEARIFPKLSVELFARHLKTEFDAEEFFLGASLADTLNRVNWTYGTAGRWALTPLTTFVVRGESIRDRFLNTPVRDSDGVRVTGGVELKPRALISGRAQIGVRTLDALDARVQDFTGLVASAELSYRLLGSTALGVHVDRDASYSFEALEPYYVVSGYGVTVRRQVAGRFDATAGFDRYRYAYRGLISAGAAGAARAGRVDITRSYSGGIGYRVRRTGRLGVGFSYWTRNSNIIAFRNYDGLRIGTSFAYGL